MTLSLLKSKLAMAVHVAFSKSTYAITSLRSPERAMAVKAIASARSIAFTATTPLECFELFNAVQATSKISGEMAEVGVFLGGTAAVILKASESRHLHLFDTFQGLPSDGDSLKKGDYAGSLISVNRALAPFHGRITLHQGLFPADTSDAVSETMFSFVHLDMDLYDGTLAALEFFWPRMSPGGIVLSHDYPTLDGVVRAWREFFAHEKAPFLPLSGQQCLAIKI